MSTRSARYTSLDLHIPKGRMASGIDREASAFLEAAKIYDSRQQRAIYELVRLLKQYGIWSKMKAVYPFVGGTATTHKWNLKDPRDTDGAFRLTFSGGWTHNTNGIKPNGINAYANSYLIPSNILSTNSNSCGYYSGSNVAETGSVDAVNMGSYNSASQALLIRKKTGTFDARINGALITYSSTSMTGLVLTTRQSSTLSKIFQNNIELVSGNSGGTLPSVSIYLGDLNLSGFGAYPDGWTLNDQRFTFVSDGLTDTEAANLYFAVQRYQQILGRAV